MGALYGVFAFVVAILLAVNPHPSTRMFALAVPTPTRLPALMADLDQSIQPGGVVPEKPIVIYFSQPVNEDESTEIRTRAYMLYNLAAAGYADREQVLPMLDNLYELDSFGQAGLALALHSLGEEEQARKLLDLLDSTA